MGGNVSVCDGRCPDVAQYIHNSIFLHLGQTITTTLWPRINQHDGPRHFLLIKDVAPGRESTARRPLREDGVNVCDIYQNIATL